jgi:hypothetical protein
MPKQNRTLKHSVCVFDQRKRSRHRLCKLDFKLIKLNFLKTNRNLKRVNKARLFKLNYPERFLEIKFSQKKIILPF